MLKRFTLFLSLCLVCATTARAADAKPTPGKPVVVLQTTLGTIKVELDPQSAPVSVKNFLDYVESGYYNDTTFHRVIPGFMIQGGGFTTERKKKATKAPIKNEADNGLKNDRGTIAMARTGDPNSATAEFFDRGGADQEPEHGVSECAGDACGDQVDKSREVILSRRPPGRLVAPFCQ